MSERDFADEDVSGLERLFPTRISLSLAIALPTLPAAVFWAVLNFSSPELAIMISTSSQQKIIVAWATAASVALALSLLLIADLFILFWRVKRRRITVYSNLHPHMTFHWLWQNASAKHFVWLALLASLFFAMGFYAAYP